MARKTLGERMAEFLFAGRTAHEQQYLPSIEEISEVDRQLDPFTLGTSPTKQTKPRARREILTRWEQMQKDPSLAEGLNLHVCAALGSHESRSEVIYIEPADQIRGKGARAAELRSKVAREARNLGDEINRIAPIICRHAIGYGDGYARIYHDDRAGIVDLMCNEDTRPAIIQAYEQGNRTIGFHVLESDKGQDVLTRLNTMQMVRMKMPRVSPVPQVDPLRAMERRQLLQLDNPTELPILPAKIGGSFLYEVEAAWEDVYLTLAAMNSQQIADAVEQCFMTVNMEGMPPDQQKRYKAGLTKVLGQHRENIKSAMLGGDPIWSKHFFILPTWGEKQVLNPIGDLSRRSSQVNTETFMINVRRMMGGIGIDMSMVGWMDMLAGGLGDGAAFHTSAQVMRRSILIRSALTDAVNHVMDLHWWIKYGESFKAESRPWKITFYSDISAANTEVQSNRQSRFATLGLVTQTLAQMKELGLPVEQVQKLLEGAGMDYSDAEALAKAMSAAPAPEGQGEAPAGGEDVQAGGDEPAADGEEAIDE